MSDEKKKSFRTLNQYIRPKKVENFGVDDYYGNNRPINVCRYHDTYGKNFYREFATQFADREKKYTLKEDGFSIERVPSRNRYSRFGPYRVKFRLADGKVYSAPTAADFRRTLPDGPRGADSYLAMKRRVESISAFERMLKSLEKFEQKETADIETIIWELSAFLHETDPRYRVHDYFHWRWLPKMDLPEQEIVGPYTPIWGARLDLALVLLRGAYEQVRANLHGLYYGRLGRHSPKWRGLLTIRPDGRRASDVPRYVWTFLVYSKVMGNISYKSYLLAGSKDGAKAKIKLRGRYPCYKDLTGSRFNQFRPNLLRSATITRVLKQFGDRLDELAKQGSKPVKGLTRKKITDNLP